MPIHNPLDTKASQQDCFRVCRGVIFAIAHVRGGGDLGQYWYLDGKMGNKPNTFKDTVAAATHLIQVCLLQQAGRPKYMSLPCTPTRSLPLRSARPVMRCMGRMKLVQV